MKGEEFIKSVEDSIKRMEELTGSKPDSMSITKSEKAQLDADGFDFSTLPDTIKYIEVV